MEDKILIGRGKRMVKAPERDWREGLASAPEFFGARLGFMTRDHHRIRNFTVAELPRNHGKALQPEDISRKLRLPLDRVSGALDDLERNLFFLVRNSAGAVSWAFPVTVEQTPHRVRFRSGEGSFAA